jgi:hypothetical protein
MMVEYQGPGTQATRENQTVLGRGGKPVRRAILRVTPRTPSVRRTRKTASGVALFGCWLTVSSLYVVK